MTDRQMADFSVWRNDALRTSKSFDSELDLLPRCLY
jgi:hypothetical protein